MRRIAWLTDIHLDFLEPSKVDEFLDRVSDENPDGVLMGGDIAEADSVVEYLARMDERLGRPVCFVLGNHDFYGGSIAAVRAAVAKLCDARSRLNYLTHSSTVALTPDVGLVGHDGWADARVGDYRHSQVMLNDYRLIRELAGVSKMARWPLLNQLGDQAAEHVRRVLPEALDRHQHVFLLTHVPPLRQACWHQGRLSDDQWAPHFTCQAVGDAILDIMRQRPERRLTVLCGHTHGSGETRPLENVVILTGGAEYGQPEVARVFDVM